MVATTLVCLTVLAELTMKRERLWLCVAPAALCLLDYSLTLLGQPATYWAGNYASYNEDDPLGGWALGKHPLAFLVYMLLWIALVSAPVLVLPRSLAKIVSLAVAMGHATGAASWARLMLGRYEVYPILFLACAALTVWSWHKADLMATESRSLPGGNSARR
jgi:hypothetical protein